MAENWGAFEFLRRAVTLPAAANSWDDIMGSTNPAIHAAAVAVTTTINHMLADAVAHALHLLHVSAETSLESARAFVVQQIKGQLVAVSPELAAALEAVVAAQFTSIEQLAEANIVKLGEQVLAEVAKVLHTTPA